MAAEGGTWPSIHRHRKATNALGHSALCQRLPPHAEEVTEGGVHTDGRFHMEDGRVRLRDVTLGIRGPGVMSMQRPEAIPFDSDVVRNRVAAPVHDDGEPRMPVVSWRTGQAYAGQINRRKQVRPRHVAPDAGEHNAYEDGGVPLAESDAAGARPDRLILWLPPEALPKRG